MVLFMFILLICLIFIIVWYLRRKNPGSITLKDLFLYNQEVDSADIDYDSMEEIDLNTPADQYSSDDIIEKLRMETEPIKTLYRSEIEKESKKEKPNKLKHLLSKIAPRSMKTLSDEEAKPSYIAQ